MERGGQMEGKLNVLLSLRCCVLRTGVQGLNYPSPSGYQSLFCVIQYIPMYIRR